ncbi:monosaccharide ABC transporter membrane protein, CUT2 family [Faunimonas pinastri]|uniref:Autoinducer 2 import system permease protein LsrD n=1 Tax=Faunimonas pinastri TaxID=1855383 RepID=A0A1H9LH89_9HYPH|nr:ABC transporter permease [Faunimonas pinastri]SER10728.1 monosaccharide ABC transporter membrane protein, CUT2 family [Faunimonas pinastri]
MTIAETQRPAVVSPRRRGLGPFFARNRIDVAITVIFVLLYAMFMIVAPNVYLHLGIYRSFMSTLPFMGVLALSLTFIVTLGEIDLSFPSVMGFSAWVFGTVFMATHSFPLALAACVGTGIGCGIINGILVAGIGVPSIVATIGTMFFWRGLANVVAKGKGIALVDLVDSPWHSIVVGRLPGDIPMQFIWFLVIAVLLTLIYRRHLFGSHVLFVGDDQEAARMMGIRTGLVKMTCFIVVGIASALSGVFLLNEVTYFWPTTGDGFLLPALAAVFIGGTSVFGGRGSMYGTFIGVLIIGSLEAGIVAMGIAGFYTQLIYGLMITISVTVYAVMMKRAG